MVFSSSRTNGNLIVFVGPFSFPDGGAAARRILGVAKAIEAGGLEVKVACGQMAPEGQSRQRFEGIEVVSLNERTAEHLPRVLKHLVYLTMGRRTIKWLDSLSQKPLAVVLYSGYSPYLLNLVPWARRNGVRLVFDAVEWYDPPSVMGWLSPYQLNIEFAMRFLVPRTRRVIAISEYLHRYFHRVGCQTLVVPPTLDVESTPVSLSAREEGQPLAVVYAGSPGHKDLLDAILEAVLRLRRAGYSLHLSVAGITSETARSYPAVRSRQWDEVCAGVDFVGVLRHDATLDLVRRSDFSVLLRRDERYARAGFPTKFVESFAVGTPVIANITSDLARYLEDGHTGFVCFGNNVTDLETALIRALALSDDQYTEMRKQCRAVAEWAFDYRAFTAPLSKFVQSVGG